jgi:hypothetical protein
LSATTYSLLRLPPAFLSSQVSRRSEPSMNAGLPFVWKRWNASPRAPKIVTSTKVGSSFHSPVCPSLKRRLTARPILQIAMLFGV